MPEALRFTTFEQAFKELSAADKARVKSTADRMAKELGGELDGGDLYHEAIIRCLRQRPWPSDVNTIAALYRELHLAKLDFARKTRRDSRLVRAFKHWLNLAPVSCAGPERELIAGEIRNEFLDGLTSDARKIADGRNLGFKGEELRAWAGLDEARFKAAYKNYQRNLLRIGISPGKRRS